jgi:hypothetical protein
MTVQQQNSPQHAYEIQTHTLCDGWINTWTWEDADGVIRPETFPTKQAARAALTEYLEELAEEASLGNIIDYDRNDFHIQPVTRH